MELVFLMLFVLGFIAVIAVYRGWILTVLWGWFIEPFFNIDTPSLAMAIGFMLIVGLMIPPKPVDEDKGGKHLALAFTSPIVALLMGWVVKQFI